MPSQSHPAQPCAQTRPAVTALVSLLALLCATAVLVTPLAGADAAVRRSSAVVLDVPARARAGASFAVTGVIRPHARGRAVAVQRRTATGWRTVARVRTDMRSHYRAIVTVPRPGTVAVRTRVSGTRRAGPASSAARHVRVVAPGSRTSASARPWAPCGTALPAKPDGTGWQCTFDDEFDARTGDAAALDRQRWTPQVSSGSGFYTGAAATGLVCYVDRPGTVAVSGGALHLSVRRRPAPTDCGGQRTSYVGGMVHTYGHFEQTYGRFEIRARLPGNRTPGVQETLWLYPSRPAYGSWPGSGEIDLAEFYSQYPGLDVPFLHYLYDAATSDLGAGVNVVTSHGCTIDPDVYNTYTLVWEPGVITLGYNGRTCLVDRYRAANSADPGAPFNQPFYLLLTQAVGRGTNAPTAATRWPATLDVDYVRAWQ